MMSLETRSPADDGPPPVADLTSIHIRGARDGDGASRDWIVARFTPLVRAQAEYRLAGPLKRLYDADDLVNEVWIVVLPKLSSLEARDGRWTPVLLRYMSTTLLHKVNGLFRKHRTREAIDGGHEGDSGTRTKARAEFTGPSTSIDRDEACRRVRACIERLEPAEREIIVLRGIEQLSNQTVASLLAENPSTVSMRYARALDKLRRWLPDSVFGELAD
jgi:RNA polymerase sigma-70 factor (ECF subfamily)